MMRMSFFCHYVNAKVVFVDLISQEWIFLSFSDAGERKPDMCVWNRVSTVLGPLEGKGSGKGRGIDEEDNLGSAD